MVIAACFVGNMLVFYVPLIVALVDIDSLAIVVGMVNLDSHCKLNK